MSNRSLLKARELEVILSSKLKARQVGTIPRPLRLPFLTGLGYAELVVILT